MYDPLGILNDTAKKNQQPVDPLGILSSKKKDVGVSPSLVTPSKSQLPEISDDPVRDFVSPARQKYREEASKYLMLGQSEASRSDVLSPKSIITRTGERIPTIGSQYVESKIKSEQASHDLAIAKNVVENNLFKNGIAAKHYLASKLSTNGRLNPNNETEQLAERKSQEYDEVQNQVLTSQSIAGAAINDKLKNDEQFAKQYAELKKEGLDLPNSVEGGIVASYLYKNGNNLAALSEQHPNEVKDDYEDLKANLVKKYPDFGTTVVANKISQEREKLGYNSSIANFHTNTFDRHNDEIASKILSPQEKEIWDANKDEITKKIDTGGFVNRIEEGIQGGLTNTKNLFSRITGQSSKGERLSEEMAKQAEVVSSGEKGWKQSLGTAGNFIGLVGYMAAGGRVTEGLGASPVLADKVMTGLTFGEQMMREGEMKYPDNNAKALVSGIANTAAFMALSPFKAGKVSEALGKIRPELDAAIKNLPDNATANTMKEAIADGFSKGMANYGKGIADMGALTLFNQGIDKMLGLADNRFHPEDELGHTLETMAIGGLIPSIVVGAGEAASRMPSKEKTPEQVIVDAADKSQLGAYNDLLKQNPQLAGDVILDLAKQKYGISDTGEEIGTGRDLSSKISSDVEDAVTEKFPDKQSVIDAIAPKNITEEPQSVPIEDLGLSESNFKKAQAQHEKAKADLQKAEDKISKKQATQQTLLPEQGAQKEMFGVSGEEAKSILEPLRNKVKETKLAMDDAEKQFMAAQERASGQEIKFEEKLVNLPTHEAEGKNIVIKAEEPLSQEGRKVIRDIAQETPQQKERKLKDRLAAIDQEAIADPYDRVLSHFANGGKIHPSAIKEIFGEASEGQRRSMIGLIDKRGMTIDQLAHSMWENDLTGRYDTQDYKDVIEQVLQAHNSPASAAKELVEKYDYDALYEKYVQSKEGQETLSFAEGLSDEEINHILQLDADKSKQAELDKYVDDLVTGASPKELPPTEPLTPIKEPLIEQGGEETGIAHAATEEVRKKYGLGEYERANATDAELEQAAEEAIRKGYNPETLISQMEKGIPPTGTENFILKKYLATLQAKFEKNPTDENLEQIHRLIRATDKIGSLQSEAFRTRKGLAPVEDSRAEFFLSEMAANNDAPLTENQKKTANEEFDKLNEARSKLDEEQKAFEQRVAAFRAEQELAKTKKTVSGGKKRTHAELAKEREDILKDIGDKWKNAGRDILSSDIPYRKQLAAIAPDVLKLAKNLVEDGVLKLEEVVKNIHDKLKEHAPDVQEKDIHDIIAGEYNEKKITRKEAAIQFENLKQQAALINKLERAESGIATTEKAKIKRNQEIAAFKKELGIDKLEQLQALKSRIHTATSKALQVLQKGNFAIEEKKTPLMEDKELQKRFPKEFNQTKNSIDQYIKIKRQIALRRLKQMYENKTPQEKTIEVFSKSLNVPRTLMASFDFSAPLRQGIVASAAHPLMASRALKFMFESAKDEKVYNRWLEDVHSSPRWEAAQKTGLGITDPESLHVKQSEEAFQGAPYAEKIPIIGLGVKASERAYIGFLNKLRWDLFNMYADRFEEQGKTFENNKRLYEGISSLINSETGRGGMKGLENAAPVLNWFLFASKLIASRLNMLGLSDIPNLAVRTATLGQRGLDYGFYTRLPAELRVEAVKDMLKFFAIGMSTLALVKGISNTSGGSVQVEDDPRSSDFGKIHVGNTRWDIWGGFQPYARTLTQFITGERKTTTTGEIKELSGKGFMGETRGTPLATFARGKLAPVPATALNLVTGRDATGQPVTIPKELLKDVSPLLFQDVVQAMKDQGVKALFTVGIPSAFGIGVQTYQLREKSNTTQRSKSTNKLANKKSMKSFKK